MLPHRIYMLTIEGKHMGEDISGPVNISADLTKATNELAQGITKGGGSLFNLLFHKKVALAKRTLAQSDFDADLIRHGHAYFDESNNEMYYLPSASHYCAQMMRQQSGQRGLENLAGTLELARLEIDSDKNFTLPDQTVDPDFQDCWQDMAEKANHEYARRLWAKILKGELQRPGSFPLRTLAVLRQLTQKEAELFTRVTRYAVRECVLNIEPPLWSQKDIIILEEAGLIMSWEIRNSTYEIDDDFQIPISKIMLKDCDLMLYWRNIPQKFVLQGNMLTQSGIALISIAEIEPMSDQILVRIFDSLKKNNNELTGIEVLNKEKMVIYRYVPKP